MTSNNLYIGEVIFFSNKRGYGFISWEKEGKKQKDMFIHFSDICCEGFKTVAKGQKVSFELGVNFKGVDKAINLKVIS